jgi:glycosyltransferase involved in cell wall biosynthesis
MMPRTRLRISARPGPSHGDPVIRQQASAASDVDDAASARFTAELEGRTLSPLVVVIAAYNEEGAIGSVLSRIPATVAGLPTSALVVVDGATDQTAATARAADALVSEVAVNRGQGAALRLGYRLAREHGARFIATLDADGQYDPGELGQVLGPLVDDRADFVTGSRRLGTAFTDDRVRGAGVVVFGTLISLLTGQTITDPANGLRAMRAEVTAAVCLREPQYQASELLVGAILRGFRVVEVPTTMHKRVKGRTKKGSNLAYGLRFARVILRTWWRERSPRSQGRARHR